LPADEIEALIQYVKYLSLRGEVERALIDMALELGESDRLIDLLGPSPTAEQTAKEAEQVAAIKAIANRVMGKWWVAELSATPVAKRPAELVEPTPESIARGREVFFTVANCNKCHGDSALGDGESNIFDKWTEELDIKNPAAVAEFVRLGALEPRVLRPRNLRQGIYRGGRRPIDIYWRVYNGIDGTGMPGVKDSVLKPGDPPDPKKLTEEDVWHLVNYVRQLPYEPVSRPTEHDPIYQRERN
jgi:mono/diheme cytochrome c family protein